MVRVPRLLLLISIERLIIALSDHARIIDRILGVRWNDFVTNRSVTDSTNLPSILSTIAARRHSFFGHIRRLPANTPAHKALKLAVDSRSGDIPHHDWNRPAGRPRTTWMSQIVRDTGLTAADAWALADDRLPAAVSEWVLVLLTSLQIFPSNSGSLIHSLRADRQESSQWKRIMKMFSDN